MTDVWFGFAREFAKNRTSRLEFMHAKYKKMNAPTIRLRMGILLSSAPGLIHTCDPVVVKHILKDEFDLFIKTHSRQGQSGTRMFREWLGGGIFAVNHGPYSEDKGVSWQFQRKVASQIFTQNNFREFISSTFQIYASKMCTVLRESNGAEIDIQDLLLKFTMDTFGHIAFHQEFNSMKGAKHPYAESFDRCHDLVVKYLRGEKMLWYAVANLFFPYPLNQFIISHVYPILDKDYREFNRCRSQLRSECMKIIKAKRASKSRNNDLLDMFLECTCTDGSPVDDDFLESIINNLFIAGRDTTALTLTWLIYALCMNPSVTKAVVEEIDETLGGEAPTMQHLKDMKYLNGALHETLRLYPVVPADNKFAAKDTHLPDGTFVPKDTSVVYFPWGMGRSEEIWGADVMEFKPERWFGAQKTQYEFPTFQAGPRICLGKEFAIFEAKTTAIALLQQFSIRLVNPNEPVTPGLGLTMGIRGGLKIIATPRKAN